MGYRSFAPATAAAAAVHVPITGSESGAIVALPGDSATSVDSNTWVMDLDTVVFTENYHGVAGKAFELSTTQLVGTTEGAASSAAFQIPNATDVTIAGMFKVDAASEANAYLIANGATFNNLNYALVIDSGLIKFQTSGDLTSTGVEMPKSQWFHCAAVSTGTRTSTKVYVNGVQVGSTLTTTAGTQSTSSELYVGTVTAAGSDLVGKASDVLVANRAYTDEEVLTLAQNAFGGSTLPAPTAMNYVPLDGTEPNIVVGFTGDGVITDLVGDSVLDEGTVLYTTNGHYTGDADCFAPGTANLISTTGDSAHKVAISSAITYAGMAFDTPGAEANPYIIVSHTGISTFNYGLLRLNGRFYIKADSNNDTGIDAPADAWYHWCVTMPAGRLTAKFYLNGALRFTSGAIDAGTVGGADSLGVGTIDAAQGDWVGRLSDIIIADLEYGATAVHTLAENAFGHPLP